MKPFNLEQALAGAPVVTRNGLPIVELKYLQTTGNLAVVRKDDGMLISYFIPCSGKLSNTTDYATDLFMAPAKKEGWINIYTGNSTTHGHTVDYTVFETKDLAQQAAGNRCIVTYIATIKIEWEE